MVANMQQSHHRAHTRPTRALLASRDAVTIVTPTDGVSPKSMALPSTVPSIAGHRITFV